MFSKKNVENSSKKSDLERFVLMFNYKMIHFLLYVGLIIVVGLGYHLAVTDLAYFEEVFVREDGWIESLSALFLLISALIVWRRSFAFAGKGNWKAFMLLLGLGAVFFFGAGEEISWGQRILGLESNEFFKANNTQDEINFHNLEWKGIKLNKLIFSQLLGVGLGFYLLIYRSLYQFSPRIRQLNDAWGIPIPRWHQVGIFFLAAVLVVLIPSNKKWELLEFALTLVFLLIVWFPVGDE